MQALIEIIGLAALVLLALFLRKKAAPRPRGLMAPRVSAAMKRPAFVYLLAGLLAFAACALTGAIYGVPEPGIHDEFSYLLAADTFAEGRLTNPPHPMWRHFETFHILGQPTYASKYPPAQGLTLALGQVFCGRPIVGVWLSVALAAAATCWMLAGWLPLRWAWIGGLLAVVRLAFSGSIYYKNIGSFAYWSQSYWGGAVAALGGALVFGALPRILQRPRARDALWLALGLLILANSRPFEGLVASLPAVAVLAVRFVRAKSSGWRGSLIRVALPATAVLLLGALWMGYYNFRVTGDPLLMPYQVYETAQGVTPPFLWQPLRPAPPYNHPLLRELNVGWSADCYRAQQSLAGWLDVAISKIGDLWIFYLGFLFTPFMAATPWMWHRPRVRFALSVWGLLILALLAATWASPHYAAPAASLAILLMVEALRQARLLRWRGRRLGPALVRAALPVLLMTPIVTAAVAQSLSPPDWNAARAKIIRHLESERGGHLVLVGYGPDHCPHIQWIYNSADIDRAKVVWAWALGREADRELIDYYPHRTIWFLNPDEQPPRLIPYSSSPSMSERQ